MSRRPTSRAFLCNDATPPKGRRVSSYSQLNYRCVGSPQPVVRLGLPDFVQSINYLPERCLDLLEIAAYVFAADRLSPRGSREAVEYQSWARNLEFVVKVRDYQFWSDTNVRDALGEVLCFATGDDRHGFTFQPGHETPPTNLFDREEFSIPTDRELSIMLFSGGIDSLAGAVDRLERTSEHVCLVSHLSQVSTIRTQRALASALAREYPGRVSAYQFKTNLRGVGRREESQRTRPFLYGSIAFALARGFQRNRFYIFENGITSLNFSRREDLLNARASRTTHPQTVGRLAHLYSMISEQPFSIDTPFLWRTKSDVVQVLKDAGKARLLPSSVSCSRTSNRGRNTTHCGECFQCLDRRIGIFGGHADEWDDAGTYSSDIIARSIPSKEGKTTAVDYLRQAASFAKWDVGEFYHHMLGELERVWGWVPGCDDENELVDRVWTLCSQHGTHVERALRRMREVCEEVFTPLAPHSLLEIISEREFLKEPVERLVTSMEGRLEAALPKAFRSARPANEAAVNDAIEALLDGWRDEMEREHPTVPFAGGGVRPDFSDGKAHVLIEGKYMRDSTTLSKITDAMAADLIKYPDDAHVLFVVYDPDSGIVDRASAKRDFERKGRCTVCIVP